MIKLLIAIIFCIVAFIFNFIATGLGAVSMAVNKRGTFVNFGTQYLKHTKVSYSRIVPYMSQLVDNILQLSKEKNYSLADETEFLQSVLYRLVGILCEEEWTMVERPNVMPKIESEATIFTYQFLSRFNLKN